MIKFLEILLTSESPREAEAIYRAMAEKQPAPGEYPVATKHLFKKNAILDLLPKAIKSKVKAARRAKLAGVEAQTKLFPSKVQRSQSTPSAQSLRKSTGEGSASSDKKRGSKSLKLKHLKSIPAFPAGEPLGVDEEEFKSARDEYEKLK
mmetsp:Transcript_32442/g.49636  ORF Transcript_32442/g.49636 Transcript_32442/m.49636 type:complete len:149 (+) Transcript_32442:738-1184(+)